MSPLRVRYQLIAETVIVAASTVVLVWDHFERLSDGLVIASGALLIGVAVHIALLYRTRDEITRRALSAERLGAARGRDAERLSAVIGSSGEAVVSIDLDGRVISWNAGAERIYGYRAKEALGRKLIDLTVPDERLNEPAELIDAVSCGRPTAIETRRRTKDGRQLEISLRAFPIIDGNEEVAGATMIAHDVTTRQEREAEDRLAAERHLWRTRIDHALDEDRFEFHGQPIIDLRTGAHSHHELLIRMRLDGKLVPPGSFLPHAESSPLMHRIDRWAVRRGIELAHRMPVAINLSARSLGSEELLETIAEALADTSPARHLTFEITETAAVENLESAARLVARLTELGCSVALDDFGTGYGSFNYLKKLPATHLKIDMDFVRGLGTDPTDERVVSTIVSMAQHFGLKTVAEGVETEQTLEIVRGLGVDFAQGYHLGHPEPLPEPALPHDVVRSRVPLAVRPRFGVPGR